MVQAERENPKTKIPRAKRRLVTRASTDADLINEYTPLIRLSVDTADTLPLLQPLAYHLHVRSFNLLENLERGIGFLNDSAQDSFIFVVWSSDGMTPVAG